MGNTFPVSDAGLPATASATRGFLSTIALVLSAVRDGREAEGCYRSLTVYGFSPGAASAETFRRHFTA